MGWLIRQLSGAFGPYIVGGVAALLLVSIGVAGWQTRHLGAAREDLAVARAALVNPLTKKTWQFEARRDASALSTCQGNEERLGRALGDQNAQVDRLRREGAAASARASRAVVAAQAASRKAAQEAAAILARRPTGDLCASAIEQLLEP